MNVKSKELEEFLSSSLSAIKNGAEGSGDFYIAGPIEFDLAVINTKEAGGGLKIYIVKAKGSLKSEEISHIKIKVSPKTIKEAKIISPTRPIRPKDGNR